MQMYSIERLSHVDLCFVPAKINAEKKFGGGYISCFVERKKEGSYRLILCSAGFSYTFVSTISIVETILDLFSPSLAGISSVPIAILFTFRSFRKRFLVISAASTAVVIACPLAFKVISLALLADRPVIIART